MPWRPNGIIFAARCQQARSSTACFLPELAWAYFNAYTTILYGSLIRYSILKIGLDDAAKYLKEDATRKILKAALPQFAKFIDDNEPETYHYLLDEIVARLLVELRKVLEGQDADQAATARAKAIMDAIRHANEEKPASAVSDAQATSGTA